MSAGGRYVAWYSLTLRSKVLSSDLEGGWQPTQLLEAIMDTEVDPTEKASVARSAMGVDYHTIPKEMLSDSPSRSFNSLPTYHFHGLAATQTQTPQNEDTTFQNNESSQKENIIINVMDTVDGDHTSNDPDHSKAFEAPPKVPTIRVPPADQAIPTRSRVTKVPLPPFVVLFSIFTSQRPFLAF